MRDVVIIGSGGHAKVCIDILHQTGANVIGLIDDYRNVGDKTAGVPVIGNMEHAKALTSDYDFFIAVGDNYARLKLAVKLGEANYINIVHPSAILSEPLQETGIVVMPGVVVNSGSYIGSHAILNTSCSIDHDNVLMSFSSIGPGVHTGGNVHIGSCSHIGIGATVSNTVTIGEHSVIGAGSTVLSFISAYKTAYGSPCKEAHERVKGDKYL